MSSVQFKTGTSAEVDATPITDGQLLITKDLDLDNKLYADIEDERYVIGGRSKAKEISYNNDKYKNVQDGLDGLTSYINIVAGMSQSQTVLRTVTRKKATSISTTEYNKITNYSNWSKYQFILVEFWIDSNNKREYDTTLLIPTSVINDTKFFCLSQSEHTTDIGVGHANLKFNIDFSSNTILQYIITATDSWKDFLYSFCIYGIGNKISSLSDLDGNGVSY